jgi:DNA-directed RNA polymerase subunit beta'
MAVHVPLSHAAILEAQLLMLSAHNILNPQNGSPITLPSQDMVLGLYYITKGKKSTKGATVQGEGKTFYSPEEVLIAYNEGKLDLHAHIKPAFKIGENW